LEGPGTAYRIRTPACLLQDARRNLAGLHGVSGGTGVPGSRSIWLAGALGTTAMNRAFCLVLPLFLITIAAPTAANAAKRALGPSALPFRALKTAPSL
jgi:hypothetical protein